MLACKSCHALSLEENCPACGGEMSKEWQGFLEILDPENSVLAKEMGIRTPGKFALRVR